MYKILLREKPRFNVSNWKYLQVAPDFDWTTTEIEDLIRMLREQHTKYPKNDVRAIMEIPYQLFYHVEGEKEEEV